MSKTSNELKVFFREDELEWRVQQCGISKSGNPWAMVLCYIQARAIEKRLDKVVGMENWTSEIRVEGNNIICRLSLRSQGGEWIGKENGASQTDIEAFKGGISGAFKRVASSGFGIGRYLYELDTTFAICQIEEPPRNEKCLWHKAWAKFREKDGDRWTEKKKMVWWKTPPMKEEYLPKPNLTNKQKLKGVVGELNQEARQEILNKKFQSLKADLESCETIEDLKLCWQNKTFKSDYKQLDTSRASLIDEAKEFMKKQLEEK